MAAEEIEQPTPGQFAALARSSPWRWKTLRFTMRYVPDPVRPEAVRAYLRRPNLLRVEDLDGTLRQTIDEPQRAWDGAPTFDENGLVAVRPDATDIGFIDAPMYQNYYWVALLDPLELADGRPPSAADDPPAGTTISDVTVVDHHGRTAWQAHLRPTADYEPRCGCCSLLRDRAVDVAEWGTKRADAILPEYPDHYRVRLDVGTGVCVFAEAVGGSVGGRGHEVVIEAVDEPMPDELFAEVPAYRSARPSNRAGWTTYPTTMLGRRTTS